MPSRREFLGSLFAFAALPRLVEALPAAAPAVPVLTGIRGLVDDGTILYGVSRSTYPMLKSKVMRTSTAFMSERQFRAYLEYVR